MIYKDILLPGEILARGSFVHFQLSISKTLTRLKLFFGRRGFVRLNRNEARGDPRPRGCRRICVWLTGDDNT
jgi:hypothetical protein